MKELFVALILMGSASCAAIHERAFPCDEFTRGSIERATCLSGQQSDRSERHRDCARFGVCA